MGREVTEPMWAEQRRQFESNTTKHQMTVLHDDGVYRHVRFAEPGTSLWHFDLITWPGHLTISGDIGQGYTFARIADMFDFFHPIEEPWRINPSYWWEKMPGSQHDAARKFSADRLKRIAQDTIAEWDLLPADKARAQGQLNDAWSLVDFEVEYEYRNILDRFEFIPASTTSNISGRPIRFYDTWEWDALDFDHHYLDRLLRDRVGRPAVQGVSAPQR